MAVADLVPEARRCFDELVAALRAHGAPVAPGVELRSGVGLLCWCDLDDGHVYLALPDPSDPVARLQVVLLRRLLGCDDDAQLFCLVRLLLPRLIAHELGHHARWASGRMGADRWQEEQLANRFASALTAPRTTPGEADELRGLLRRAFAALAGERRSQGPLVSFDEALRGLSAAGALDEDDCRAVDQVAHLLGLDPARVLAGHPAAARRSSEIERFNEVYTDDLTGYLAYQVGWWLTELDGPSHHHLDALVRAHLAPPAEALVIGSAPPTARGVAALFHASTATADPCLRRFWYRRYRSLLLAHMEAHEPVLRGRDLAALGAWTEGESDPLDWLEPLVGPASRACFPTALATVDGPIGMDDPGDRRVWAWHHGAPDAEVARLFAAVAVLERAGPFRTLAAERLLALANGACVVLLEEGEVLLHEGARSDDVYVIAEGRLRVEVGGEARAELGTADLVGELAFFTGRPRSATLRALEPTRCLALPMRHLRRVADAAPVVWLELARTLAGRLESRSRGNELEEVS